ncbi:MAG: hypothetical protein JOZ16_00915 [Methylobacteriaceae bacterium]|nr:hypothetical protein [Methylobacteriaceae bacterium]
MNAFFVELLKPQPLLAIIAGMIAFLAYRRTRAENRRWKTLEICSQFELNAQVAKANSAIYQGFRNGTPGRPECEALASDAILLLNYLDGIAIGVVQGLYIEQLAKDHLCAIVHNRVQNLLESTFRQDARLDAQTWCFLVTMTDRWRRNQPYFTSPWRRLLRFVSG